MLHAVTVRLKDSYIPFWRKCLFDDSANVTYGNKLRTHHTFKTSYCLENYLLSRNNSRKEISTFANIRISCYKLHIEEGRYRKIPLQERICQLCNVEVEDEKYFVLSCSKLETCRKSFCDKINYIYPTFSFMNISDKFKYILLSKDYDLNILCMSFIFELYNKRNLLVKNGPNNN